MKIFLLLIFLNTLSFAIGERQCIEHYKNHHTSSYFKERLGRFFYVHLKKSDFETIMQLENVYTVEGKLILYFRDKNGKIIKHRASEVLLSEQVSRDQIEEEFYDDFIPPTNSRYGAFWAGLIHKYKFLKYRYIPWVEKIETPRVNVYLSKSQIVNSKKVLELVSEFDQFCSRMGFSLDGIKKTHILFSEKQNFKAPFFSFVPKSEPDVQYIYLSSEYQDYDLRYLSSILLHERVHGVTDAFFKSANRFFNVNLFVKEAVADFMAAHFLDNPRICIYANNCLRDIEKGQFQDGQYSMKDVITREAHSPYTHDNSIKYSNIFWNLRQSLGVHVIDEFFLLILKNLDIYQYQYAKFNTHFLGHEIGHYHPAALEHYLLVVILKTFKNSPYEAKVNNFVKKVSLDLYFDFNKIKHDSELI